MQKLTGIVLLITFLIWSRDVCLFGLSQSEEKNRNNSSIEQRLHELEDHYAEATTLLHIQGSLIYDLQAQIQNLSLLVEKVRRNPGCMINIVRTSPMLSAQETLHPGKPCLGNLEKLYLKAA